MMVFWRLRSFKIVYVIDCSGDLQNQLGLKTSKSGVSSGLLHGPSTGGSLWSARMKNFLPNGRFPVDLRYCRYSSIVEDRDSQDPESGGYPQVIL